MADAHPTMIGVPDRSGERPNAAATSDDAAPVSARFRLRLNLPLLIGRCNKLDTPIFYNFVRTMIPVDDPLLLPISMLPSGSFLTPGCELVDSQLNPIPQFAPPGRYYISGVTVVQGHWRAFTIPWETAPFRVAMSTG